MKATVSIETIGHKKAEEYLANQVDEQRKRHDGGRHIMSLAKEMATDNFVLSNDAIVLVKGRLANGQNRLSAITITKKAQEFIVLRTDNEDIFKIMDCGKNRKISDTLIGVSNSNIVASIARMSLFYDYDCMVCSGVSDGSVSENNLITRSDIQERVNKEKDVLEGIAAFISACYVKSGKLLSKTVSGTLLYIVFRDYPKYREAAKIFIEKVYDGSSPIDCPARMMRERMVKNITSKAKISNGYAMALLIKAWIAYRDGNKVGTLKMADGESFPRI